MIDLLYYTFKQTIPAAYSLLPGQMNTREATAMMLATGLHESAFKARVQGRMRALKTLDDFNPQAGPARGFWQFERGGGVAEILESPDTKDIAIPICKMFLFDPNRQAIHTALGFHDVLQAVFARLLLWRDSRPMPTPLQFSEGYSIYLRNWRPNVDAAAAHKKDWPGNFTNAWNVVKGV
jgi:hypothetical protein